jgi:hypothetical protein
VLLYIEISVYSINSEGRRKFCVNRAINYLGREIIAKMIYENVQ